MPVLPASKFSPFHTVRRSQDLHMLPERHEIVHRGNGSPDERIIVPAGATQQQDLTTAGSDDAAELWSTEVQTRRAMGTAQIFLAHTSAVGGNLVLSPWSVLSALSPLYAGAAGPTQKELGRFLGFALGSNPNEATAALGHLQGQVNDTLEHSGNGQVALSLWTDTKRTLQPMMQAHIKHTFRCSVRSVALGEDPCGAARLINSWSNDATRGALPEIIAAKDLEDSAEGLVLLSAIYVDAEWQMPFTREAADTTFTDEAAQTPKVRMLSRTHQYAYCDTAHFSAVVVPYMHQALQMEFVLPHVGRNWRDALLDGTWVGGQLPWSRDKRIALALPSFEFDSTIELGESLCKAGVVSAFSPQLAEFDPLTGPVHNERRLYLARVMQKAKVAVNERGTRAAAVTACFLAPQMSLPRPVPLIEMRLDRPFLFLMRHVATREVMFIGKVGLASGLTDAPAQEQDHFYSVDEDLDCDMDLWPQQVLAWRNRRQQMARDITQHLPRAAANKP